MDFVIIHGLLKYLGRIPNLIYIINIYTHTYIYPALSNKAKHHSTGDIKVRVVF